MAAQDESSAPHEDQLKLEERARLAPSLAARAARAPAEAQSLLDQFPNLHQPATQNFTTQTSAPPIPSPSTRPSRARLAPSLAARTARAPGGDGSMFSFLQVRRSFCALFPPRARVSLLISGEQKRETALRNEAGCTHRPCSLPRASSLDGLPPHRHRRPPSSARPPPGSGLSVSLPKGEPETAAVIHLLFCISQEGWACVLSDDVIIRGYEHCPRMIRMIHVQGGMHNATSICHYKKVLL